MINLPLGVTELDAWQKNVLETKGNICLCSGRQVGKSTVISIDAGEYAVKNQNKVIMIISATERQALLLFEKVLSYIYINYKSYIKKGKDKPTKHTLRLKNGTIIHCLPTGDSGYGIRGYTINRLYADEAHFIKEEVWAAVTPMLATTGGDIILLSTPFGTEGYFHRCFHSKQFTSFHVSTEEVALSRVDPQKTSMMKFLEEEKLRMTRLQYQQEYLGLFVGGIQRWFTDEEIEELCCIKHHSPRGTKYQGIDIAREGGDECVLVSLDMINRNKLIQFDLEIPEGQKLTDTARLIIHKDKQFHHKKIYMDDGGLGVGVFDMLFEDPQTKRKVIGINNAQRSIDIIKKPRNIGKKRKIKQEMRRIPLMKEDNYVNFKILAEQGRIQLLDDPRIKQSLRSVQCDASDGKLKFYGNYDHIAEALVRAARCVKDKSLNIMSAVW